MNKLGAAAIYQAHNEGVKNMSPEEKEEVLKEEREVRAILDANKKKNRIKAKKPLILGVLFLITLVLMIVSWILVGNDFFIAPFVTGLAILLLTTVFWLALS